MPVQCCGVFLRCLTLLTAFRAFGSITQTQDLAPPIEQDSNPFEAGLITGTDQKS